MESFEIMEPGMLTTIQDLGRFGYQRFGVPVSGAMDSFAHRVSNILVGNRLGDASLEMTALGPQIRFLRDAQIALTGADLAPSIDGQPVAMWRRVPICSGNLLQFKQPRDGCRSYMALNGGIDVPRVMGSRSTYLPGKIGGLEGRPLGVGDVLKSDSDKVQIGPICETVGVLNDPPNYGNTFEARILLGPQNDAFTAGAVETLLNSEYLVSMDVDRVGCRLDGPKIPHRTGPDIVSEGNPLGAIQVPGDGQPIVLLADRGTTGGYAKIATVISVDIALFAQVMPGDVIRFTKVSLDDACKALADEEDLLSRLAGSDKFRRGVICVDGARFDVVDDNNKAVTTYPHVLESGILSRTRATVRLDDNTYEFDIETTF